jgi:RNA polymerase sigma-70 factor, ECF subfamily
VTARNGAADGARAGAPAGREAVGQATCSPPRPGEPEPVTWEQIARTHGSFLYTLAYRLTSDPDDAQDLVQDTLLRVRRGLPSYQPGSMRGWLTRIATNAFIDQTRRRRRRSESSLSTQAEGDLPSTPGADSPGAHLPIDLQEALAGLPSDYRLPVVLCDVADRSYQEIADILGLPIGTVRSRIHRGRMLLRRELE